MTWRFNPFTGTMDWTDPAPSMSAYVPYTGATGNVDLGANNLSARNLYAYSTAGTEIAPALQAANWTVGAGWAAPAGTLDKNADGSGTATPTASMGIVAGHRYKVVITLSYNNDPVNRSMNWTLGGASGTPLTTTGTYTDYVTTTTTANIIFTPSLGGNRETITAVSVIDVTIGTGNLSVEENARIYGQMGIGSEMNAAAGLTIDRPLWAKIKGTTFKTGIIAPLYICGGSSSYNPGSLNSGMFFENGGSANGFFVFQIATQPGVQFTITNAGNVNLGAIPGGNVPSQLAMYPGAAATNWPGLFIKGAYSADYSYQKLIEVQDRTGATAFDVQMRGADSICVMHVPTLSTVPAHDANGLQVLTSGNAAQFMRFKGIALATSYAGLTPGVGEIISQSAIDLVFKPGASTTAMTLSSSDQSAVVVGDITGASIKTDGTFLKHKVIRRTLSATDGSNGYFVYSWSATASKIVMLKACYLDVANSRVNGGNDYDAGGDGHWLDVRFSSNQITVQKNATGAASWAENDIITVYVVYEK